LAAGLACATRATPSADSVVDPKFSMSSFIEDGSLVALIVGTRPTAHKAAESYVPFEVAVVNKGLAGLTLTRESFTLVDEQGNEYPTVGREELSRGYGNIDLDRRLGEIAPVVRGRYQSYAHVPSTLTASFDHPMEQRLSLHRFSYAVDFLYFPRPATGIGGRRFTLFMRAAELPDAVFVKVQVPGKPAAGAEPETDPAAELESGGGS
jgi:hypothetical protein